MLDKKLFIKSIDTIKDCLRKRGINNFPIDKIVTLLEQKKKINIELAKQIEMKSALSQYLADKINDELIKTKIFNIKITVDVLKSNALQLDNNINNLLSQLPNFISEDTQIHDEVVRTWSPIQSSTVQINKKYLSHTQIWKMLNQLNNEIASNMSCSKFHTLYDEVAKLHRSLGQFMLDFHVESGYKEVYVPYLVNKNALYNTGQLPKFIDDLYKVNEELFLIPTAEVPLTNIFANLLIKRSELPIKVTALTPCFRMEAGSYNTANRGLVRQHQFDKVELVQLVEEVQGEKALEEITHQAELILQKLEIPYRVIKLGGNNLSFSAYKSYDIEVWRESIKKFMEVSSCSWCSNFQTRRMKTRIKNINGSNELCHTLNGSGLAVGRTLIALLEHHQVDNKIIIPQVLHKYFGKEEIILEKV